MVIAKLAISIADGVHTATIKRVEERTDPYEYTDLILDVPVSGKESVELKYGSPTAISFDIESKPTTKLAKLLTAFGMKIKVGQDVTLKQMNEALSGKKCKIMTETEDTEKGKFARILSCKPE